MIVSRAAVAVLKTHANNSTTIRGKVFTTTPLPAYVSGTCKSVESVMRKANEKPRREAGVFVLNLGGAYQRPPMKSRMEAR